jgi:hypothetical protein
MFTVCTLFNSINSLVQTRLVAVGFHVLLLVHALPKSVQSPVFRGSIVLFKWFIVPVTVGNAMVAPYFIVVPDGVG